MSRRSIVADYTDAEPRPDPARRARLAARHAATGRRRAGAPASWTTGTIARVVGTGRDLDRLVGPRRHRALRAPALELRAEVHELARVAHGRAVAEQHQRRLQPAQALGRLAVALGVGREEVLRQAQARGCPAAGPCCSARRQGSACGRTRATATCGRPSGRACPARRSRPPRRPPPAPGRPCGPGPVNTLCISWAIGWSGWRSRDQVGVLRRAARPLGDPERHAELLAHAVAGALVVGVRMGDGVGRQLAARAAP